MEDKAKIKIPYQKIAEFCRKRHITELSLFGSVLRSDFGPQSDIDILVTFSPETDYSLFDLVRIQDELSEIVGHKVELAEKESVAGSANYIRRKRILNSARVVYVA